MSDRFNSLLHRMPQNALPWCASLLLITAAPSPSPAAERLGPEPFTRPITRTSTTTSLLSVYEPHFWDARSGLPYNRVTAIYVDHQGYLWVGSFFGLSRFNGQDFVDFSPYNTPSLKSDTVTGIVEDDPAHFFVATTEHLYRSNGRDFEEIALPGGIREVKGINKTISGDLLVATSDGLVRINQVTTNLIEHPYADPSKSFVQRVDTLYDGTLTVSGVNRVDQFDPGSQTARAVDWGIPGSRSLRTGRGAVLALDKEQRLWFRDEKGIFRVDPHGPTLMAASAAGSTRLDPELLWDDDGNIWTSDKSGRLSLHRGEQTLSIDLNAQYRVTLINVLYQHGEHFWFGSEEGLILLKKRTVENYSTLNGMPDRFIYGAIEARPQKYVVGTRNGPALLDETNRLVYALSLEGLDRQTRSASFAPDNGFWISNENYGPLLVKADLEAMEATIEFSPARRIWDELEVQQGLFTSIIKYDRKGHLWFGTSDGAIEIMPDDSYVRHLAATPPLSRRFDVRTIYEHRDGSMWLGSEGHGIAIIKNQDTSFLTVADGLSGNEVFSIVDDPDGQTLWVATDNGITRIRDDQIHALTADDGIPPRTIHEILFEDDNTMWITSLVGVHRIGTKDIDNYLRGPRDQPLEFLTVNAEDGMFNAETNGERQPNAIKDSQGRFLIPTIDGLAIFDPEELIQETSTPDPPIIEKILIDGEIIYQNSHPDCFPESLSGGFVIEANKGDRLEIELAAPPIGLMGRTLYEVKFGKDDTVPWEPLKESSAIYTTLEPGTHFFQARAADKTRVWSAATAPIRFVQRPHYYQTPWFDGLMFLAAIYAAVVIHRRRMRYANRIQQLEQEAAVISERERIARDMHDDLGSRLTQISLIGDIAKRSDTPITNEQISELNQAARQAARAVEEIVWAVSPNYDSASGTVEYLLLYAEHQLENAGIACRNQLMDAVQTTPLSPDIRHTVLMTFKEAVNNVIKHADASEVRLSVHHESGRIRIRVADNGHGFDPSEAVSGNGLRNMTDRMREIGGSFRITSTSRTGTIVEIVFPTPQSGGQGQRK